ncbi:polymer-forming cytoskeletal protein [Tahibacter sp.]|uniref:bactofilin family protein n=1 Tax=Tahibacter sp. TaxID=2056211 RepID=UPI0028C50C1A|nr:polymer-forming cytoskeletal protein [Tahibacter sp.]
MFSSKKSNGKSSSYGATTLIARGTTIRGDLTFSGAIYLEGRIEGTLRAEGDDACLTLSDQGTVIGEIHAPRVVLNGEVKGDVHAAERLELAEAARIEGNIFYKVLEMAAGAQINGKMIHQAEAPKRLPAPEGPAAAGAKPA